MGAKGMRRQKGLVSRLRRVWLRNRDGVPRILGRLRSRNYVVASNSHPNDSRMIKARLHVRGWYPPLILPRKMKKVTLGFFRVASLTGAWLMARNGCRYHRTVRGNSGYAPSPNKEINGYVFGRKRRYFLNRGQVKWSVKGHDANIVCGLLSVHRGWNRFAKESTCAFLFVKIKLKTVGEEFDWGLRWLSSFFTQVFHITQHFILYHFNVLIIGLKGYSPLEVLVLGEFWDKGLSDYYRSRNLLFCTHVWVYFKKTQCYFWLINFTVTRATTCFPQCIILDGLDDSRYRIHPKQKNNLNLYEYGYLSYQNYVNICNNFLHRL